MISGTSKMLLKCGPVDLPIITNILQQIQEKYGNIFKTHYFHIWESGNSKQFVFLERYWHHCFCVVSLFRCFVFLEKWIYIYIRYINLWRWGSGNDMFSKKTFPKAWILISYLSKNMKWECGKSYQLFYFQENKTTK